MNLPNVPPVAVLGLCFASDLALGTVGHANASPLVWAGAGAYSFVKGHPIWGATFVVLGSLSYIGNTALRERKTDLPGPDNTTQQVTSGPLRGLQAVLSANARKAAWR